MSAVPRRVWTLLAVAGLSACGSDSNTAPAPPPGTADQVPRVLAVTSVNGKSVPVTVYTSRDGLSDSRVDSGSATLQDDSMLVVRTYVTDMPHGTKTTGPWSPWSFTSAGVLDASGVAVFHYTDGAADTAHVLANGAVVVPLSIKDDGVTVPFGTFTFTQPYHGVPLNPLVRVRDFSPAQGVVNSGNFTLTITGSHFMPATTFLWGTTALGVTYVSASQISVDVPSQLLGVAGPVALTMTNPGPGGGTRIYSYDVVSPRPMLTAIQPATVGVGTPSFGLQVTGNDFTNKSVVTWNGTPLQTSFGGPTLLSAAVPGSFVAMAQTVQVAVQTPGPGGGTSKPIVLAVVGTPPQDLAELSVPITATQIVGDPVRSLVYASTTSAEHRYPNSILAIDPTTGQLAWTLDVGKSVGTIAVTDDGQYLYVGRLSDSTVSRVALATHTIDTTFSLGSQAGAPLEAYALGSVPGAPHSVVVLRSCYCPFPQAEADFTIYDDGVPRANRLAGSAVPLQFAFAQPGTMYGVTQYGLAEEIAVDASGTSIRGTPFLAMQGMTYVVDGTRLYTSVGDFFDMTTRTRGTLSAFSASPAISESTDGRYLYGVFASQSALGLQAFDLQQNAPAGAILLTTAWDGIPGRDLVRWGPDGLAFLTGSNIIFVRASFVH